MKKKKEKKERTLNTRSEREGEPEDGKGKEPPILMIEILFEKDLKKDEFTEKIPGQRLV